MKQTINLKRIFWIFLLTFSILPFASQINAQAKKNKKADITKNASVQYSIDGFNFDSPDGYVLDEKIGDKAFVFKGELYEKPIYMFITIGDGDSELEKIRNKIADKIKQDKTSEIQWKKATPMLMLWDSKYKKGETGYLGLKGERLFNFVSRRINFKDKNINVGFVYEWVVYSAKKVFEDAGNGEHAIACNSAVTLINSITKEKPEKLQYCYLKLGI